MLDSFSTCPNIRTPIMNCKFVHSSIEKNILHLVGSVSVSKNLSPNFSLVWHYKKCPMGFNVCSNQMDFPVPGICSIISSKTIFGDAVGKNFAPKLKCPIERGQYSFNFSLSLEGIRFIPSIGNKYHIKLELLSGPRQESVACIELVSWIKNGK